MQRVDWVRQSRFFWINTSPVYHDGIRITAADKQGKLIYYLGTQHDVTQQIRAEDELRRLNELLAEADS